MNLKIQFVEYSIIKKQNRTSIVNYIVEPFRFVFSKGKKPNTVVMKTHLLEIKSPYMEDAGMIEEIREKEESIQKAFSDEYKKFVFKVAALLETKGASKL